MWKNFVGESVILMNSKRPWNVVQFHKIEVCLFSTSHLMMMQSVLEGTHNTTTDRRKRWKEKKSSRRKKKNFFFCFNDDYNNDIPINGKSLHVLGLRFNFSIAMPSKTMLCVAVWNVEFLMVFCLYAPTKRNDLLKTTIKNHCWDVG